MKQIRTGVFETNSSSTHSICIAKDVELTMPPSVHFEFGEFGWETRTLKSLHKKASYLYTGLVYNERNEDVARITEQLKAKGVDVTFEEPIKSSWGDGFETGYVDHGNELTDFLNDVCGDEQKLLRFLFSDLSFILTGNDNDDEDVEITVAYPHDEYYKGN